MSEFIIDLSVRNETTEYTKSFNFRRVIEAEGLQKAVTTFMEKVVIE